MLKDEDKIVLLDEENNELEFAFIDALEVDGEEYAVLAPVEEVESAKEVKEAIILKIGKDENGEEILFDIEDDEEWDRVANKWQKYMDALQDEGEEEGEEEGKNQE
ncbi:MAG: DUF1292 domain-containing protein [Peptococcia bacterium]|jgi:uncharacterized protein YrzB (UPF0473 family)